MRHPQLCTSWMTQSRMVASAWIQPFRVLLVMSYGVMQDRCSRACGCGHQALFRPQTPRQPVRRQGCPVVVLHSWLACCPFAQLCYAVHALSCLTSRRHFAAVASLLSWCWIPAGSIMPSAAALVIVMAMGCATPPFVFVVLGVDPGALQQSPYRTPSRFLTPRAAYVCVPDAVIVMLCLAMGRGRPHTCNTQTALPAAVTVAVCLFSC